MQVTVLPSGFKLRPARLIDAQSIARIHVGSWRETYRGIISQRHLEARTVKDRTEIWHLVLSDLPKDRVFIIVEVQTGVIVGFAYGGPARELGFGPSGELYAMYLLKKCQGRGVGRALFSAFRTELGDAGMNDLYALVLEGNSAKGFFLKMGGRFNGYGTVTRPGRRGGRRFAEERFDWE